MALQSTANKGERGEPKSSWGSFFRRTTWTHAVRSGSRGAHDRREKARRSGGHRLGRGSGRMGKHRVRPRGCARPRARETGASGGVQAPFRSPFRPAEAVRRAKSLLPAEDIRSAEDFTPTDCMPSTADVGPAESEARGAPAGAASVRHATAISD